MWLEGRKEEGREWGDNVEEVGAVVVVVVVMVLYDDCCSSKYCYSIYNYQCVTAVMVELVVL